MPINRPYMASHSILPGEKRRFSGLAGAGEGGKKSESLRLEHKEYSKLTKTLTLGRYPRSHPYPVFWSREVAEHPLEPGRLA